MGETPSRGGDAAGAGAASGQPAMQKFLARALAEAHARGGVVDRLTPSGISVLFGAPVRRPLRECAQAAMEAARGILDSVAQTERALTAKIVDFGLAGLLSMAEATGTLKGTPASMSPELWSGGPGDARSDLYSLGIVLFEMLTGRPPFKADRLEAWFACHVHEPAPDLREFQNAPEPWAALVARALRKSPEERFGSAAEMRRALRATIPEAAGQAEEQDLVPATRGR